jgi:acetyltransferase
VLALDARIRVAASASRPAIKPYPAGLARRLVIGDESFEVRPIRPEDGPRLVDLVARSDAEDVRLRFRTGLRRLPDIWAARLSQIDYDREMALVALDRSGEIAGVARLAGDPEGETAEFALLVRSDHQQRGLGMALLQALVGFARDRGYRELWGSITRENSRMLDLAHRLGFVARADADPLSVRSSLSLGQAAT